jgi:hypothetical protein
MTIVDLHTSHPWLWRRKHFAVIPEHGGGLAWYGNYLSMADTSDGVRVFDLTRIREVSTSTTPALTRAPRAPSAPSPAGRCP